jgi:hypothetical protein
MSTSTPASPWITTGPFRAAGALGLGRFSLTTVAIAHLAATWFMVGLIWTIHTVHYPLFAEVGADAYVGFQAAHLERIGPLLVLPWLIEGVSAAALLLAADRDIRRSAFAGAIAMAVVLVISGFWSAPAHAELTDGFDAAVHGRLLDANLVRTLAWTVRGVVAIDILRRVLRLRSPQ